MTFKTLALAALALVAAPAMAVPAYESYVAVCNSDSQSVHFINFPSHDCKGESWNVTNPLESCEGAELPIVHKKYTWNAFCNDTDIWFMNYNNMNCTGKSILTRTYITNKCENCPWYYKNCKQGGPF